jgi:hypothetical protein
MQAVALSLSRDLSRAIDSNVSAQHANVQASPTPSAAAVLELDVGVPEFEVAPRSAWARNDTLRILGILLPPCAASMPGADESHNIEANHASSAAALQGSSCLTPLLGVWRAFQPTFEWLADTLDMPDYVTHLSEAPEQRNGAHSVVLALALVPMLLMRFSIPTLAGDFYDPALLCVATLAAPFAASRLFGVAVPLWLLMITAAALTAVAAAVGVKQVQSPAACRAPAASAGCTGCLLPRTSTLSDPSHATYVCSRVASFYRCTETLAGWKSRPWRQGQWSCCSRC